MGFIRVFVELIGPLQIESGRVHMRKLHRNPIGAQRMGTDDGKYLRDPDLIQIIQRLAETVAVEIICNDPITNEQIHWLGPVELRGQI